jgi:WD repeat-containing protein 35
LLHQNANELLNKNKRL